MTRILIADDHTIVRAGLRALLFASVAPVEIGEADSFPSALVRVRAEEWNLVILDVGMPGGQILEAIGSIKTHRPDLPVLVLSMHSEQAYAVRTLAAGASGYISKGFVGDELVTAVRRALAGRKYISPAVAEQMADTLHPETAVPAHDALSKREHQVLSVLAAGHTVKECGIMLHLSAKTVSTYRTRVLTKLGLRTTAELVRYSLANRLLPLVD